MKLRRAGERAVILQSTRAASFKRGLGRAWDASEGFSDCHRATSCRPNHDDLHSMLARAPHSSTWIRPAWPPGADMISIWTNVDPLCQNAVTWVTCVPDVVTESGAP